MPDIKSFPKSVQEWAKKYGTEEQLMNPEPGLERPLFAPDDMITSLLPIARVKVLEKMAKVPSVTVVQSSKSSLPTSGEIYEQMLKRNKIAPSPQVDALLNNETKYFKSLHPKAKPSEIEALVKDTTSDLIPMIDNARPIKISSPSLETDKLSREQMINALERHSQGLDLKSITPEIVDQTTQIIDRPRYEAITKLAKGMGGGREMADIMVEQIKQTKGQGPLIPKKAWKILNEKPQPPTDWDNELLEFIEQKKYLK